MAAIEWMCAEYGIRLSEGIWDTSLVIPLLLLPVRNQRHGGESGPSYADRASMKARNQIRGWLEENFSIVPKPLSETGWVLAEAPQPI